MRRDTVDYLLRAADTIAAVTCSQGHISQLSPGELEESIYHNACLFEDCGASLEDVAPERWTVTCAECDWTDDATWQDTRWHLSDDCPNCHLTTPNIVGSYSHFLKLHARWVRIAGDQLFARPDRPDISSLLIHFCQQKEFLSILTSGMVLASPTRKYKQPVVCLTEAPLSAATAMRNKFGAFGLAFRREDILSAKGQPVIQVTDRLLRAQEKVGGFAKSLQPFVNVIRPKGRYAFDFTHEREWRVASTISLSKTNPVGLIFPQTGHPSHKFSGPGWKTMLKHVFEFGELIVGNTSGDDDY